MINVNVFGGWWQQHRAKKEAEEAAKKQEIKAPDKCVFCNKKIEEGDYFCIGYDRHRIYAETCDHIHCKQWLEHKIRRKKI